MLRNDNKLVECMQLYRKTADKSEAIYARSFVEEGRAMMRLMGEDKQ